MSIHVQLSPEAQVLLAAQRRNSSIGSGVIALLVVVIIGLVLGFFLLPNVSKEIPVIVTYASSLEEEKEVQEKKITNKVQRKPSSPSSSMAKVIAANTVANVSIPVPENVDPVEALDFGDGNDFGTGWGEGEGAGSGGRSLFGSARVGSGLKGTFYDFKRTANGSPSGVQRNDVESARKIAKGFVRSSRWAPPRNFKYFTSPTKLYSKVMAFKGIPDTDAGKAFQSPETKPGLWFAHYEGDVVAQRSGDFRFVGWGDNCLIVGINGDVVLDASDHHYTGDARAKLGSINVPGKPRAAVFQGKSFRLTKGKSYRIDVLLGDEGGIFSAAAMFLPSGERYPGGGGVPNLPTLVVADLAPDEIDQYHFIRRDNLVPKIMKSR